MGSLMDFQQKIYVDLLVIKHISGEICIFVDSYITFTVNVCKCPPLDVFSVIIARFHCRRVVICSDPTSSLLTAQHRRCVQTQYSLLPTGTSLPFTIWQRHLKPLKTGKGLYPRGQIDDLPMFVHWSYLDLPKTTAAAQMQTMARSCLPQALWQESWSYSLWTEEVCKCYAFGGHVQKKYP